MVILGVLIAAGRFVHAGIRGRRAEEFGRVRLGLARYVILGLEFQLASDVLTTAISPTFRQFGQLAAIAAIRTVLKYVLRREVERDRLDLRENEQDDVSEGEPVSGGRSSAAQ